MAAPDFYNILGIARGATPDDVKRAYRILARRWHPDRNPADADAELRFKDITVAYRTLSDPERRARYDRLGPLYTEDGRPPRPEDLNQVATTVWTNLFRWRQTPRGEDLRFTLSITLEEVAAGADREIVVPRQVRCRTCSGEGADPDGGKKTCPACKGTGRASGPRLLRSDCYHCAGRGFLIVRPCADCSGEGRRGIDDQLLVKVPPGVATGQKLKLGGKGNAPRRTGDPGDLLVVVSVADHPLFERKGDDAHVELPLTFADLALGAEVKVPTLEGSTAIHVPPGSPPGKTLKLAGRGLPRLGRKARGDLLIDLVLEIPSSLDEAQRTSLRQWLDLLPSTAHPRRATFVRLVKDRS